MEQGLSTPDTSGLFALLNRRDRRHEQVRAAFVGDAGPYLVPAGILAEISYVIERRLGLEVLTAFASDLKTGRFVFECGEEDLGRIGDLVAPNATAAEYWPSTCAISAWSPRKAPSLRFLEHPRPFG